MECKKHGACRGEIQSTKPDTEDGEASVTGWIDSRIEHWVHTGITSAPLSCDADCPNDRHEYSRRVELERKLTEMEKEYNVTRNISIYKWFRVVFFLHLTHKICLFQFIHRCGRRTPWQRCESTLNARIFGSFYITKVNQGQ
jgi:hypothetical protein